MSTGFHCEWSKSNAPKITFIKNITFDLQVFRIKENLGSRFDRRRRIWDSQSLEANQDPVTMAQGRKHTWNSQDRHKSSDEDNQRERNDFRENCLRQEFDKKHSIDNIRPERQKLGGWSFSRKFQAELKLLNKLFCNLNFLHFYSQTQSRTMQRAAQEYALSTVASSTINWDA